MSRTRGFRIGRGHVVVACSSRSGNHRWLGQRTCVRCGLDYRETTKNWTGWEVRQRRLRTRPARQDGLCSGNYHDLGLCLVHQARWPIDQDHCNVAAHVSPGPED